MSYNFPRWNYGYTLGPGSEEKNGDYKTFVKAQAAQAAQPQNSKAAAESSPKKEAKPEVSAAGVAAAGAPAAPGEDKKEEGEIIERPLTDILKGRNPIVFCNEESKVRGLHVEWEQVSETGPPHQKIFTWSLKLGEELSVTGSANSKKAAKAAAAVEMCKKLDQLPKVVQKRRGGPGGRGGFNHHNRFGRYPPQQYPPHQPPAKRKKEENASTSAETSNNPLNPSQNNPISQLYEFCKKQKAPEPVFNLVEENVLESRRSIKGFNIKKVQFTIECDAMGKKYNGVAMTKKLAKTQAAASAWAELGPAKVGQSSIESLLQSSRAAGDKK